MAYKLFLIAVTLAFVPVSGSAQIASGGAFTLEKSVVASGGGAGSNGAFAVTGTGGQSAAGTTSTGAPFSQTSGFWTPEQFAPTAAGVIVEGRVATADGLGIRNVRVTLTGGDGAARSVVTGSFGYFRFTDVAAGSTYFIGVSAKKYTFAAPTQVITVTDNVADLNFVAEPQ